MECDLLINAQSGSARAASKAVVEALEEYGFMLSKVYKVNRRNPLADALRSIVRRKPHLLVVAGGDGTVSTVLSRLVGKDIQVIIIPLGTTNNFARSLEIPLTIREAVAHAAKHTALAVDMGVLNGKYFANVASVGVSAEIAKNVSLKNKYRFGRAAYVLEGFRQFWRHKPFTVTIEDSRKNLTIKLETHQIIIANGRYHAGKQVAEDASIDNGQLILFALGGASRFSLMLHLLDFYFGKRRRVVHSSYFIGREVTLTTDAPLDVEVDGEVSARMPLTASVERAAIEVRHLR
jgi:YegS/Rv2252/BmrU family lipid kinase